MKIESYLCDKEGCSKPRVARFAAFHHSQMDASGNGSERWYAAFDLCGYHAKFYADELAEIIWGKGNVNTKIEDVLKKLNIKFELE